MTTFIIPDDVNFECQQCGQCCRNKWNIGLEDAALAKFSAPEMRAVYPDIDRRHVPFEAGGFHHRLVKDEKGACVFLTAQNTCGIHARVGREFKPGNCILFPYQFTRTPRGVTVGFVFDCTGVAFEGIAPRAGLDLDTLEDVLRHTIHVHELPATFRFSDNGPQIGFDVYERTQQILMHFLAKSVFPLEDGLIAGAIFLKLADEFIGQAMRRGYNPGQAVAALFRNAEDQDHQLVRRLIKPVSPRAEEQRSFFDFLATSHEATSDSKDRMAMVTRLMSQALNRKAGKGEYRSVFLDRAVSLEEAAELPFDPEAEPANTHLRRYLKHLVFRHVPAEYFSSLQGGQLYLQIVYGLVRWYARALACSESAPAVDGRHVREAIRVVETNYVFANKLHEKLANESNLRKEFDRWLADKLTPYRLVRSV